MIYQISAASSKDGAYEPLNRRKRKSDEIAAAPSNSSPAAAAPPRAKRASAAAANVKRESPREEPTKRTIVKQEPKDVPSEAEKERDEAKVGVKVEIDMAQV